MADDNRAEREKALEEKYGLKPGSFASGETAAARRRAEIQHDRGRVPVRPVPVSLPPQLQHENKTENSAGGSPPGVSDFPSQVKIWSFVALSGIQAGHGNAARLWFLARALDESGSGWVKKSGLWAFLRFLGVQERTRRRWLRAALDLSLLIESRGKYTLAGLGRGAFLLGCKQVGRPSLVGAADLVRKGGEDRGGWRDFVWSAYEVTNRERPVSQETKFSITAVPTRTQRYHLARVAGYARRNYVKTDIPGNHLTGVREHGRGSAFVSRRFVAGKRRPKLIDPGGRVMFRLPDVRHVPLFISLLSNKGRSKKAQKTLLHLSLSRRVKGIVFRVFHVSPGSAERAIRHLATSDIPPWEMPAELFERVRGGRRADFWRPVPVGIVQK